MAEYTITLARSARRELEALEARLIQWVRPVRAGFDQQDHGGVYCGVHWLITCRRCLRQVLVFGMLRAPSRSLSSMLVTISAQAAGTALRRGDGPRLCMAGVLVGQLSFIGVTFQPGE